MGLFAGILASTLASAPIRIPFTSSITLSGSWLLIENIGSTVRAHFFGDKQVVDKSCGEEKMSWVFWGW